MLYMNQLCSYHKTTSRMPRRYTEVHLLLLVSKIESKPLMESDGVAKAGLRSIRVCISYSAILSHYLKVAVHPLASATVEHQHMHVHSHKMASTSYELSHTEECIITSLLDLS